MSDSSSTVTYTSPVALPSPDYVPGPEHPPSLDYVPGPEHPPSPVEIPYVPEPEYPEYLAPSDDEAPLKDQPLPTDASPITASPDHVADSDPNEDPEEDREDDQADYHDDGEDGDNEPFDDHDDDDTGDEDPEEGPFEDEEDDEEGEHLAPTDSFDVSIVDLVLPARDTEALEANEPTHAPRSPIIIPLSQTHLYRARKTFRPEPPILASMEACIARYDALPSPPLLVPSLPLHFPSPLTTSPTNTGAPLGYRAAKIRMRALLLSTSRSTDIYEADMPPRKRACLTTPALGFEIRESSAAGAARQPGPTESDLRRYRLEQAGYGSTDMQRMDEFEIQFEEAQDDRALLRARVNTLFRDRPDHRRTAMLIDREVMYAREAWAYSEYMNSALAAHVRTLETHVVALIAQTLSLQTQLTTALGRIEILEARDPEPREGPAKDASSWTFVYLLAIIVKFTSCTLQRSALTWWNSHMRAVEQDVAYAMPWAALKRMITDKYYPRGEIQKLKSKYWNLKVKGLDLLNCNHRFQELALMCDRMFPEESTKVERYIDGLPDMIHGSVKASKPQSMQEAIEFATEMMDKKMLTHAERQSEHKRKFDDTSRNNQHQQQPFKRNNVAWAYTTGPRDKKPYGGTKPLCRPATTNNNPNNNNQRAQAENVRGITFFECGVQGHYKSDYLKPKNGNQENRAGNRNVMERAYDAGIAKTNPNSNVVTDHGYDVELADGRII
nr:hypothetical protein [Tanacetum cinerariifolium]